MNWSFNIGKIFGIRFRIHVTFLLLVLFIFASVANQHGFQRGLLATLFIGAVFACVLIHEIGHSLIARRFGKEVKSITLLPIGGVATMEEMPEKPAQEIVMSLVGPLINLAIAGILYVIVGRWSGISVPTIQPDSSRSFLAGLIGINIMLAIFNLIPAFPMDGGRVLRGILAMTMDYVRATSLAVAIGQILAMLFIFYGVFFNWWIAIIGLFLYIGAGGEKQQVILKSVLHAIPASEAMTTTFRTLRPDEPIARALEHFYHGCQDDFPVVGEAGIEGILTRDRILATIHDKGVNVPVSDVMDRDFASVTPRTPLDEIYKKSMTGGKTAVAVVDGSTVKGMLCMDGISRFLAVKAALSHAGPKG
jgi:Zn-dependent protease/predicted transcriptional regulator